MPKCPSRFCDNPAPENAKHCRKCGAEINLLQEEQQFRDVLYQVLSEMASEHRFKIPIDRGLSDFYFQKHLFEVFTIGAQVRQLLENEEARKPSNNAKARRNTRKTRL
jgi:hypothetical protein